MVLLKNYSSKTIGACLQLYVDHVPFIVIYMYNVGIYIHVHMYCALDTISVCFCDTEPLEVL